MEQLEKYAEHAQECRAAARKAGTATERDHLLEMAERWESLARQRAAHMHLEGMLIELLKPDPV